MQNSVMVTTRSIVTSAMSDVPEAQINLKKRPRVKESLIQGFLFLCGALSILTTIGIVYGLGKESLNFFTRQLWEDTNKQLVVDMGAVRRRMSC